MNLEFKGTKKEWVNGYGQGLTGPTTPTMHPFCCEERDYIPISFDMQTIAIVVQPENNSIEEMEANAKLIAASPDLLEALQYTLEQLKGLDGNNPTEIMIINKCEKTIEKALK